MKHLRSLALFTTFVVLFAGCSFKGAVGQDGHDEYVYVTNQGDATVSVISVATNEVVETVDLKELGYDAGSKPHHVAVEPDGSYWYVTLISAGRILKFNRDNELQGAAEFEVPGLLSMDPSSDLLYVARSMAAVNPPQRIGAIDKRTMEVEEIDVFFPRPHALAVAPDGEYVFSASLAENRIIAYHPESGESIFHTLEGPVHTLVDLEISPDGSVMVAGGELTGAFFFFDPNDPEALPILETIQVNAKPWHPVFSSDGSRVYFANKGANTVTVVDVESREVVKVIEGEGLAQPHGAGLSSNGRFLYVSSNNLAGGDHMDHMAGDDGSTRGMVAVIDTETLEIVKVLHVGPNATGVGARPVW